MASKTFEGLKAKSGKTFFFFLTQVSKSFVKSGYWKTAGFRFLALKRDLERRFTKSKIEET